MGTQTQLAEDGLAFYETGNEQEADVLTQYDEAALLALTSLRRESAAHPSVLDKTDREFIETFYSFDRHDTSAGQQ